MLKRTDIVDEKMLDDLKVIAEFNCHHWNCGVCPFNVEAGCMCLNIKDIVERYENGEEVIY